MSMQVQVHPRDELEPQKLDPLPEGHGLIDEAECPGCGTAFQPGDVTTLIVVGPGADPAEQAKLRAGRAYIARTVAAHWSCVTGEATG